MSEPAEPSFTPEAPTPAAAPPAGPVGTTAPAARPPAPANKPVAPAKPAAPAAPVRPLPTDQDIADWVHGAEVPLVGALFEGLTVQRLDTLVMQIRKDEILPQHWQVIADRTLPPDPDLTFERLPELATLRVRYKDQELSRRRIGELRLAWGELAGKQPSRWTVPDLLAALRRLLQQGKGAGFYDLLSAQRDVWRDLKLPHGKEQGEILWACLAVIRKNTKK